MSYWIVAITFLGVGLVTPVRSTSDDPIAVTLEKAKDVYEADAEWLGFHVYLSRGRPHLRPG